MQTLDSLTTTFLPPPESFEPGSDPIRSDPQISLARVGFAGTVVSGMTASTPLGDYDPIPVLDVFIIEVVKRQSVPDGETR